MLATVKGIEEYKNTLEFYIIKIPRTSKRSHPDVQEKYLDPLAGQVISLSL